MHVQYWDNNQNYVATRYYHSEFMGKASPKDVFETFTACLSGVSKSKLLQGSTDGTNANLSFLDLLEEDKNEKELSQLIHSGTCGLYTLHISMKHGEKASGWNVKKLLSSLHRIFDESPSKRADYEALTQAISSDYPLQFCAHCWVENERVAMRARAREIWPKIVEIIGFWKGLPKSKKPGKGKFGANTSYGHLCSIQRDPLVPLKLQFFEDISKTLNYFLVLYQTGKPMVLFLAESLETLLTSFLRHLSGKMCLSANRASLLIKLDVADKTNRKESIVSIWVLV